MDDNPLLLNEEDLKVRLLAGLLADMGVTPDELKLEKAFSLKFGKARKTTVRSDVLCSRGGSNLFVIELKSPDHEITPEDVDQGVSYARLVHPIAPYVILTNGRTTRVFDTIRKDDLTGKKLQRQAELSLDEEVRLRYDELQSFVGYSRANLRTFSAAQVAEGMQRLREESDGREKKYLPSVFVSRTRLAEEFERFLKQSDPCFAIIGEPGVGKTNSICNLAESFTERGLALFYDGTELSKGISQTIQEDFCWFFSAQASTPQVIRRLSGLAGGEGTVIFVDAVDEVDAPNFVNELGDLLAKLCDCASVKVCVACKDTEWPRFLRHRGTRTRVAELTYSPRRALSEQSVCPGFRLERFSSAELEQATALYKGVFALKGTFSDDIKSECRLGFNLRILSETYLRRTIPAKLHTPELVGQYLCAKFSKGVDEVCWNVVIGVARLAIERGAGEIDESTVREALGLSCNERLSPDVFASNVLQFVGSSRPRRVCFAYSNIRSYLICFCVLKLRERDEREFQAAMRTLLSSAVGQSALQWVYPYLTRTQRDVMYSDMHSRGLIYVRHYAEVIAECFPRLREQFAPGGSGQIGLVTGDLSKQWMFPFGFRQIRTDERVVEDMDVPEGEDGFDFLERHGVSALRMSSQNFLVSDPIDMAEQEVDDQLSRMMKAGTLNEDENRVLALETILAIVDSYRKELGFKRIENRRFVLCVDDLLPLTLEDIRRRVREHLAGVDDRQRLEAEVLGGNRRSGFCWVDPKRVAQERERVLNAGCGFPYIRVRGDVPPWLRLLKAIDVLSKTSEIITESFAPGPDICFVEAIEELYGSEGVPSNVGDIVVSQFSNDRLKKYCESFFVSFLREYRTLVGCCFPAHRGKMALYSLLPARLDIRVRRGAPLRASCIEIGFRRAVNGTSDEVDVALGDEKDGLDRRARGYEWIEKRSLDSILHWSVNALPLEPGVSSRYANCICPLRNMVYTHVNSDLRRCVEGGGLIRK